MDTILDRLVEAGTPLPTWSITDGALTVTAGPATDLFIDPAATDVAVPNVGRLVAPVASDFILSAELEVDFAAQFDAGVLFVEYDELHWFKLCFEYTPLLQPSVVTVVTRGTSDDSNSWLVDGNRVRLRVARVGTAFALHSSFDGVRWDLARYFTLGIPAGSEVRVGFLSQSPLGEGCRTVFRDIRFSQETLADTRDGS